MILTMMTTFETCDALTDFYKMHLGNAMHEKFVGSADYARDNILLNCTDTATKTIYLDIDLSACKYPEIEIKTLYNCFDYSYLIYQYMSPISEKEPKLEGTIIFLIKESPNQKMNEEWIYWKLRDLLIQQFVGEEDFVENAVVISDLPRDKQYKLSITLNLDMIECRERVKVLIKKCLNIISTIDQFIN